MEKTTEDVNVVAVETANVASDNAQATKKASDTKKSADTKKAESGENAKATADKKADKPTKTESKDKVKEAKADTQVKAHKPAADKADASADAKDATDKPEVEPKKEPEGKAEVKEEVIEVKADNKKPAADENVAYPYTLSLTRPVSTYRSPGAQFNGRSFGGSITVLGGTGNYLLVKFIRSGVGICTCYMLRQEVERCHL